MCATVGFDYSKGKVVVDEIQMYLDGRYLSATEATWRLFEYEITRRDPSVKCYPVHLKDENLDNIR